MKKETINLMPGETKGINLGPQDTFEMFFTNPHKKIVPEKKIEPTGQCLYTFTNRNDSPAVIKITRTN